MLFYTSCTTCYLPLARVLGQTLKRTNPDAELYIVLSDDLPKSFDITNEPFAGVISGKEIELKYAQMSVPYWIFLHDKTELCTAVKGWAALELLQKTSADKIVYLDPDIAVLRSLDTLEKELDDYDVIVSPHRLAPEPLFDDKHYCDQLLLMRGVFNLGFLAVRASENGLFFLRWWQKMLELYCYADDPNGLFTDQKIIDLAPAFFDFVNISRNEGYNISWWNITQRKLSGSIDNLLVNGKPAYFYHFSQWNSGLHKDVIKTYRPEDPTMKRLVSWYEERLLENGAQKLKSEESVFDVYTNGTPVHLHTRQVCRLNQEVISRFAYTDPFNSEDPDGLYQFLLSTCPEYIREDHEYSLQSSVDYQSMYQNLILSRSYKLGRKVADIANSLFPKSSYRRRLASGLVNGVVKQQKRRKYVKQNYQDCCIDNTRHIGFPTDTDAIFGTFSELADKLKATLQQLPTLNSLPCTVIVRNISSLEDAERSLYAILTQSDDVPAQIIMACIPEVISEISEKLPQFDTALEASLSKLVALAKEETVFFLSKWLGISRSYFLNGMAALERYHAGLLQPMLLGEYGRVFEAGAVLLQNGKRIPYGKDGDPKKSRYRYAKEVDTISPLAFVANKSIVISVCDNEDQKWDQEYQLCDLSFRMRANNEKVMYASSFCAFNASDYLYHNDEMPRRFASVWKKILQKENIASESSMFLGRDRSQHHKLIFACDDRVPRPDFSAGDRTMYQYLQLWVKMGYSVKYVGDEMVRVETYDSEVENMGVEIIGVDGQGDMEWQAFLADNGRYIDYAYLCRPHILKKYRDALLAFGKPQIVYYCVDIDSLRQKRACEVAGDYAGVLRAEEALTHEIAAMKKADTILTISEYEKKLLDEKIKRKHVMLNPIYTYSEFPIVMDDFSSRSGLMFVGGFKHSPNGDAMTWFCQNVLPQIIRFLPNIKMHIVGNNPPPEVQALAGKNVFVHGYVNDDELVSLYQSVRIVVVPLRYGAGVKGKLIEAMYYGMPIVSTSIGTEGLPDIDALLPAANTAEEFSNQVIALYHDLDALKKASKRNQDYVRRQYCEKYAVEFFNQVFSN